MGAIKHRDIRPPAASSSHPDRRRPLGIEAGARGAQPATFTARLVALDERGKAWISADDEIDERGSLPGEMASSKTARTPPLTARSTVPLRPEHVGREVLACRANRSGDPIIVGLLIDSATPEPSAEPAVDLTIERRRIVLAAETEVVLRCGDGSITLAADGKVTIRGIDVVSTATRTQRIRGGAVRIN